MKKLIAPLCMVACTCVLVSTIHAQSLEAIKAQMVKDWERAKAYTLFRNFIPIQCFKNLLFLQLD